jgi:glycosyltransferase involved in cell wall biosynthesis
LALHERRALGAHDARGVRVVKVLLLAHAFAPHNASGSVRAVKLAEFFDECGYDLRVITAAPLAYPRTLAARVPEARVLTTRWLDVFAPLEAARRLLPGAAGGGMGGTTHGALPFSSHLVASRLARRFGCPWIAEYRDFFAGNPYQDTPAWRDAIDRRVEAAVMRSAAASVTISPPMAEELARRHGKPAVSVPNGYDPEDFAAADAPAPFDPEMLTILYTGIIYPGRRDPSPLFAALAGLAPEERARIELRFHGQDLRGVAEMARRHGVEDRVRVGAAVPYRTSLAWQKQADVLLLLLWDDPREQGVCPAKLFEYAGAGRPVLSLGYSGGVAADLIRTRGLGHVGSDAGAIAAALRAWLAQKRAGGVAAPPEDARAGLSRRDQFNRLRDFLRGQGLVP